MLYGGFIPLGIVYLHTREPTDNPHPELGDVGKDFNLLTYSSTTTLTLCEMKYYFEQELGMRKRNTPYDAPLWVGSAVHAGLEAFTDGGGLEAATVNINKWAEANPIMGGDVGQLQIQEIAKARAMVRAAAEKWNLKAGAVA